MFWRPYRAILGNFGDRMRVILSSSKSRGLYQDNFIEPVVGWRQDSKKGGEKNENESAVMVSVGGCIQYNAYAIRVFLQRANSSYKS